MDRNLDKRTFIPNPNTLRSLGGSPMLTRIGIALALMVLLACDGNKKPEVDEVSKPLATANSKGEALDAKDKKTDWEKFSAPEAIKDLDNLKGFRLLFGIMQSELKLAFSDTKWGSKVSNLRKKQIVKRILKHLFPDLDESKVQMRRNGDYYYGDKRLMTFMQNGEEITIAIYDPSKARESQDFYHAYEVVTLVFNEGKRIPRSHRGQFDSFLGDGGTFAFPHESTGTTKETAKQYITVNLNDGRLEMEKHYNDKEEVVGATKRIVLEKNYPQAGKGKESDSNRWVEAIRTRFKDNKLRIDTIFDDIDSFRPEKMHEMVRKVLEKRHPGLPWDDYEITEESSAEHVFWKYEGRDVAVARILGEGDKKELEFTFFAYDGVAGVNVEWASAHYHRDDKGEFYRTRSRVSDTVKDHRGRDTVVRHHYIVDRSTVQEYLLVESPRENRVDEFQYKYHKLELDPTSGHEDEAKPDPLPMELSHSIWDRNGGDPYMDWTRRALNVWKEQLGK